MRLGSLLCLLLAVFVVGVQCDYDESRARRMIRYSASGYCCSPEGI